MRGFTLLELMIALAIAGILACAALPSYRGYVLRANRAAGRAVLLEIAAREEGRLADRQTYTPSLSDWYPVDANGEAWFLRDGASDATAGRATIYRVRLSGSEQAYALDAVPVNAQAADTACGTLRYDSAGGHGASGPLGPACWR